jgi:hypothetical protein
MNQVNAVAAEPADKRKARDYSERKNPRITMREYDPPPNGALIWNSADVKEGKTGQLFRDWRSACFWRWKRGLVVRSIAILLPDYAVRKGYAYPGNTALARESWVDKAKIDKALTAMVNGRALIRVYAFEDGNDKPTRRLYLAKAVIDDFKASSKTDDMNVENR